jgi:hypothetical protein
MAEKLIPISRKQHDAINSLADAIKANQQQLTTVANVLLLGQDEDLGQVGIVGARSQDGVYSLVIEVPDIAPLAEVKEA